MLTPFQLTAKLCKMNYLPPFAVQGTHRIKEKELGESAQLYSQLITFLSDESNDISILKENDILNDHFVKT
jgi:glutathione-regulated potassium-efflux system ancillary protein KefG